MPIIHIVPFVIFLYVGWRFIPPLPISTEWKWIATFVLLAIAQQHLVIRLFFGSLASPELPSGVIAFLGWLFGAFIILAAFLVAKDAVAVIVWGAGKAGLQVGFDVSGFRWGLGLCAAALVISGYGVWQTVRVPDVRNLDIHLADLPVELDGLTVAQISDLHASGLYRAPWVRAVVDKTNALQPDLLLLTGDLVDGPLENRTADVAPLGYLKARLGVYAITGNHEYYSGHAEWMAAFGALGLHMLLNDHVVIHDKGASLVVAGITDSGASRFNMDGSDLQKTLAGRPKDAPVILMAHRPGDAPQAAEAGVDLQLSGHTHGGQIPGVWYLARRFNNGFVSGLYRVGAMQLYVSNGTGLWGGFPLRIATPSEITLITLRTNSTR